MISQVIVSREALVLDRQFIYKEQAHTHTKRKERNDGKLSKKRSVVGNLYPTDLKNLKKFSFICFLLAT